MGEPPSLCLRKGALPGDGLAAAGQGSCAGWLPEGTLWMSRPNETWPPAPAVCSILARQPPSACDLSGLAPAASCDVACTTCQGTGGFARQLLAAIR